MLEKIRGLIKAGWKVTTETHTAFWLYEGLVYLGLLPALSSVPAIIGWETAARPYLIGLGILIWAALFLCMLAYSGSKSRQPDAKIAPTQLNLEEWLDHPSYFVWVASCLWIGQKPVPKIDQDHPAYPTLQMIKGYLQDHTIKSLYGNTGMVAKVHREELLKLAGIRHERPDFLFKHSTKGDKETALYRLTHLRSEGVVLRNEIPTYFAAAEFADWEKTLVRWMKEVIEVLRRINNADAEWFATLDTVPPARVAIPNIRLDGKESRGRFASLFRQHDYRLFRLDGLLKKYGVGSAE